MLPQADQINTDVQCNSTLTPWGRRDRTPWRLKTRHGRRPELRHWPAWTDPFDTEWNRWPKCIGAVHRLVRPAQALKTISNRRVKILSDASATKKSPTLDWWRRFRYYNLVYYKRRIEKSGDAKPKPPIRKSELDFWRQYEIWSRLEKTEKVFLFKWNEMRTNQKVCKIEE